jgi:hypothetical protein
MITHARRVKTPETPGRASSFERDFGAIRRLSRANDDGDDSQLARDAYSMGMHLSWLSRLAGSKKVDTLEGLLERVPPARRERVWHQALAFMEEAYQHLDMSQESFTVYRDDAIFKPGFEGAKQVTRTGVSTNGDTVASYQVELDLKTRRKHWDAGMALLDRAIARTRAALR